MYLKTLGELKLEESELTRPKPLLLLAYLSLEGPRERRHLAELFWSGARDPRQSLSVALSQIRKHAPGALETEAKRVETDVRCDVAELERLFRKGKTMAALDLYRGPFLAGLDLELGVELEEWLFRTRESLAAEVRRELIAAGEVAAAAGDFEWAGTRAEEALGLGGAPLLEPDEIRRLHRLLTAAGSLRRRALESEGRELGAGDLPASREEARAELREIASRRRREPPTNIPARTTSFVGREEEIDRIAEEIRGDESRLITLVGPPGVGKTRLAMEVGRTLHRTREFPDGIFFVSLAGLTDSVRVPARIAEALELGRRGRQPTLEVLCSRLRARRLLLLLDNFEHLVEAAPEIAELVRSCPRLSILATSRVPLQLTMERERSVSPLTVGLREAGDAASRELPSALSLFAERARAVRSDFAIDDANRAAVAEVCRRVDGLPLAIELAAARIKIFSPRDLADGLDRRLDLLEADARDRPSRHRTLTAAIAWSHELLDEGERRLFRRLAVFHGGFTIGSVRRVTERLGGPGDEVLSTLTGLVDQSLVRRAEYEGGGSRFFMLETVRQYAIDRLREAGEEDAALEAHAEEMSRLAEEATPHLSGGGEQRSWLERLRREHDDLRAALDRAEEEGDAQLGLRLAAAIWRFWVASGHLVEGTERLERLLRLPTAEKATPSRARALNALATMRHETGDFVGARPLLEESLEIWRGLGEPGGIASVLDDLAWVELWLGDTDGARALAGEALAAHGETGGDHGRAVTLNNLGWLAFMLGDLGAAEERFRKSLELRRRIDDRRGEGFLLANLAWVAVEDDDPDRARELSEEAFEIFRRLRDEQLLAWALRMRGLAALSRDRVGEALRHLEVSVLKWRRVGNRAGLAGGLTSRGRAFRRAGELESSEVDLDEAISISRRLEIPWYLNRALLALSETVRARGDEERASDLRREADRILAALGE